MHAFSFLLFLLMSFLFHILICENCTVLAYIECVWHWLKKLTFLLFSLFLVLFMGPIALFSTIYGSHCTFWYYLLVLLYYFSYFLILSTVLLAKSFQFSLNKLFSNRQIISIFLLFRTQTSKHKSICREQFIQLKLKPFCLSIVDKDKSQQLKQYSETYNQYQKVQ